jgi:hypothetical protein
MGTAPPLAFSPKDATRGLPHHEILAAGQLVRDAAQALRRVGDVAQGTLILEPLPVSLLLRLLRLDLGLPGLLPLLGLGLGLGLSLLGAALGLLGLVADHGAVSLLGLAHGLVHGPTSLWLVLLSVVLVTLDAREGRGGYTPALRKGAQNELRAERDQLTQFIRGTILPSVESLAQLQAQGKVVPGGYPIGRPTIMLLVDAESEEELYEIVEGLPIWEQVEITRMQVLEELVSLDETAES